MTPGFLRFAPLDNVAIAVRPEGAVATRNLLGIATGSATVEETGREIFRLILAVAGGRRPSSEQLGLDDGLVLFNPAPVT